MTKYVRMIKPQIPKGMATSLKKGTIKSNFESSFMEKPPWTHCARALQISALLGIETANARYTAAEKPTRLCQANFSLALMPFGSWWTTLR